MGCVGVIMMAKAKLNRYRIIKVYVGERELSLFNGGGGRGARTTRMVVKPLNKTFPCHDMKKKRDPP
jgi:hypothetical protein